MPAGLRLVPVYLRDQAAVLRALSERLERTLGVGVEVAPPGFDPEMAFDPSRGQYNSRLLLGALLREPAPESTRMLGVAGVDLFIPVLTFVFGEAQLKGRAAVVSTHRLQPELYGLPPDPALFEARLAKEALHELGHTFGLIHCPDDACVMRSSTYVEEIDLKPAAFCPTCRPAVLPVRSAEEGAQRPGSSRGIER